MPTAENNQNEQENQHENRGVLQLLQSNEKKQTTITPMRMRLPDLMLPFVKPTTWQALCQKLVFEVIIPQVQTEHERGANTSQGTGYLLITHCPVKLTSS